MSLTSRVCASVTDQHRQEQQTEQAIEVGQVTEVRGNLSKQEWEERRGKQGWAPNSDENAEPQRLP
jgi:hypothetical protein